MEKRNTKWAKRWIVLKNDILYLYHSPTVKIKLSTVSNKFMTGFLFIIVLYEQNVKVLVFDRNEQFRNAFFVIFVEIRYFLLGYQNRRCPLVTWLSSLPGWTRIQNEQKIVCKFFVCFSIFFSLWFLLFFYEYVFRSLLAFFKSNVTTFVFIFIALVRMIWSSN